jgi:alanine racemase
MRTLEAMIRPDIGILTNIGLAHISAFSGDRAELAKEKFQLFHNITRGDVVVPVGDPVVTAEAVTLRCRVHHFGERGDLPFIESHDPTRDGIRVHLRYPNSEIATFLVRTPSVENARTVAIAAAAASLLGVGAKKAESALDGWEPGSTRMEMWRSPSGITIINDSCSADPLSVRVAIDTLSKWNPNGPHRTFFVFHGIRGVAETENVDIGRIAAKAKIDVFVPVEYDGSEATEAAFRENGGGMVIRCHQIEDVRSKVVPELRSGDVVLVKGPRRWGIAHAASVLVESMAPNRFIVDLEVLRENIRRFGGGLRPTTRILAVVKALAYGSDGSRVAADLQREGLVSHFGVASADEGVALRAAGIVRPILVFMCTPDEARKAIQHTLTPVVYSKEIADHVERAAESLQTQVAVHIEVDTGMGRLGEFPEEVPALATRIINSPWLKLEGIMTHFASADDPTQDDFTERQIQLFDDTIAGLREIGITGLLCHANATAASARFPNAQYDMVRLGLGIYGIYPSDAVRDAIDDLQLAIALVSRIAEIRVLPQGHEIGYSRTFMVPRDDFRVGIVPIGYHDGIPWRLGTSGKGYVLVNGKPAAILGRISMDSMVIDLSSQPEATQGMDVLIFGRYGGYELRPEAVAASCDTIAHELLVRIGPRVQRIFVGDSA